MGAARGRPAEKAERDAEAKTAEAISRQKAEQARLAADKSIAEADNDLRIRKAELAREAALKEAEQQEAAAKAEEARLQATEVQAALAQRDVAKATAEGEAASVLEEGKARAAAVESIGQAIQKHPDALKVMLVELMPNVVQELARSVNNNGGTYIVPAFSGLFAPYWRADARGVVAGLTRFVNKGHIARAVLEASAYQTLDIVEAMNKDSGVALKQLKVDGGMVANELLMQFQADILDVPVIRPEVTETTALGAAYAAGLAVGYWTDKQDLKQNWAVDKTWESKMSAQARETAINGWKKAVERTFNWVE